MWAAGVSTGLIASRLGMPRGETASVIIQRARDRGDPRAAPRACIERDHRDLTVPATIKEEAEARGLSVGAFVRLLLDVIARDKLVLSILDDEPSPKQTETA